LWSNWKYLIFSVDKYLILTFFSSFLLVFNCFVLSWFQVAYKYCLNNNNNNYDYNIIKLN
jgi:hypothetical protein